ncbi:putative ribonuclease H-like domain-containing protein, partial [Tanacetum coccineum]
MKDASFFYSSSKEDGNDEPKFADDDKNEVKDGSYDENDDKEKSEDDSSTKQDNNTDQHVNTASLGLNTGSIELNIVDELEVDLGNIPNSYVVPTTPHTRIHKDHPIKNMIGDMQSSIQIRRVAKPTSEQGFLSTVYEGKTHEDLHTCHRAIGKKWIFKNKKDERGIVIRNKTMLVAQGHTQEECIDYDDVFAPVART